MLMLSFLVIKFLNGAHLIKKAILPTFHIFYSPGKRHKKSFSTYLTYKKYTHTYFAQPIDFLGLSAMFGSTFNLVARVGILPSVLEHCTERWKSLNMLN